MALTTRPPNIKLHSRGNFCHDVFLDSHNVEKETPPSSRERDWAQLKRAKMVMREEEPPFDPLGQLYI